MSDSPPLPAGRLTRTGVLNIAYWYDAMPFAFIASHFWGAWLAIGALLVWLAVAVWSATRFRSTVDTRRGAR